MPEIKGININKFFLNKKTNIAIAALYQVNFTIPSRLFTVVLGPSGCGKTTLLKVIGGLYDIDGGELLFDDIDITNIPANKRYISYVSQEFALYPNYTIFHNIAFPLKIQKVPVNEIRKRVNEIADLLQIKDLISRRPKMLSIGQQQRVALARALVKHPDIVLLDEPFSNLDTQTKNAMLQLLKNIKDKLQTTFIMVTHHFTDVINLADYIIQMDNGEIIKEYYLQQEGSTSDLI